MIGLILCDSSAWVFATVQKSTGGQRVDTVLVNLQCVQWYNNHGHASAHNKCMCIICIMCSINCTILLSFSFHIFLSYANTHAGKSLGTSQRTASAWLGPWWRGGDLTAVWSRICQPLTVCQTGQELIAYMRAHTCVHTHTNTHSICRHSLDGRCRKPTMPQQQL